MTEPNEPHNHVLDTDWVCVICDWPYHRGEDGLLYITIPRA